MPITGTVLLGMRGKKFTEHDGIKGKNITPLTQGELDIIEAKILERIAPYAAVAKEWWKTPFLAEKTGDSAIRGEGVPPQMYVHVAKSVNRSPVRNVGMYPFTIPSALQLPAMKGGAMYHLGRALAGDGIIIDGMRVLIREGFTKAFRATASICFVPDELYREKNAGLRFLCEVRECDIYDMVSGRVPKDLFQRVKATVQSNRPDDYRRLFVASRGGVDETDSTILWNGIIT